MNRLERLFAIEQELRRRAPGTVSAAALAEQFGTSRRTIERDLASLRNAGVALYGQPGRSGGQTVLGGGRVSFSLSAAEVTAVLVALTVAPDTPFGGAGLSAAHRLIDVLPAATRVSVEELRSRLRVVPPESSEVLSRVRHVVEEAVRVQQVVRISYVDGGGAATRRAVDPVGFYGSAEGWYLVGWCHLRRAGRIFRLDRIRSARMTTSPAPAHDLDETLGWVPAPGRVPG